MAPSQLKQLKAQIQARRSGSDKKQQQTPQTQSRNPPKNALKKARPISLGEEQRRATLLRELQSRHKVGGIIDRRIGENDPTMAPEDRALQRYVKQRGKRGATFNLEDDDAGDDAVMLTHGGRAIDGLVSEDVRDDFDDVDGVDDGEEEDELFTRPAKKRRLSEEIAELEAKEAAGEPERKKSKKEVMEEVIAKSKLYKYERQQAKDEDEAIREELDKGMPDLMALLRGTPRAAPMPPPVERSMEGAIHPDRLALLDTDEVKTKQAEKEYDKRLRQLAMDKRAAPTERTKTGEEKLKEDAERLKELENKRQRRMQGEEESEEEVDHRRKKRQNDEEDEDEEDEEVNEAADFGLADADPPKKASFDVEDEDEFVIEDDLIASGSDMDEQFDEDDSDVDEEELPDDDSEFLADVVAQRTESGSKPKPTGANDTTTLAYTYPCPQDHAQFLDVIKGVSDTDMPVVIQRIRALYHPQLNAQNKEKLSHFAVALVDHIAYMATQGSPLSLVETVIRHVHSLSRTYPETIGRAFRAHLIGMQEQGTLQPGDLFILTAIGSTYPTSDHFHQVVTPAITIMARWMEMTTPKTPQDMATGAYVVALAVKYQALAKRYIPEAVRFTVAALKQNHDTKCTTPHIKNLTAMMDIWRRTPCFLEIFTPLLPLLSTQRNIQQTLKIALSQAQLRRRPLELHHHRPLPIKSSVPKFEESFDPTKHYDPDRERAEAAKLKAEYRREKKGALRELKKDSSFLAREKLKQKKEADAAYEAKQRRLIAEIQGEEGHAKNEYEREKKARKRR